MRPIVKEIYFEESVPNLIRIRAIFSNKIITFIIAGVWLLNGLVCKVLNLVPRHEQIVARILGSDHAPLFTLIIGISEICMAVWIMTRFKSRLNAILQIIIILTMNILEFFMVPDLLLWGKLNFVFALLLVALIYYNEYFLHKTNTEKTS